MGETEPNTSKNVTNLFIIWWAVTVQENVCRAYQMMVFMIAKCSSWIDV